MLGTDQRIICTTGFFAMERSAVDGYYVGCILLKNNGASRCGHKGTTVNLRFNARSGKLNNTCISYVSGNCVRSAIDNEMCTFFSGAREHRAGGGHFVTFLQNNFAIIGQHDLFCFRFQILNGNSFKCNIKVCT